MDAFVTEEGLVAPMDRSNVDTDAIIPKQFLKSIKRSGFGPYAFDEWRYLDHGEPDMDCTNRPINPEFELNQARYQGASILITRKNFGCGSSRDHSPWALLDYGFRCIISPSFADIFYNNCFKNGILPIIQPESAVDRLFEQTHATEGYALRVDLPSQTITLPDGDVLTFDIDEFRKDALLKGLDEVGLTLQHSELIKSFEDQHRQKMPWVFTE